MATQFRGATPPWPDFWDDYAEVTALRLDMTGEDDDDSTNEDMGFQVGRVRSGREAHAAAPDNTHDEDDPDTEEPAETEAGGEVDATLSDDEPDEDDPD